MSRKRLVPLPRDGEEWVLVAVAVGFLIMLTGLALYLRVDPLYLWVGGVVLSGGALAYLGQRALVRMDEERREWKNRPEPPWTAGQTQQGRGPGF
jgi:hypothetical protein